MMYEGKQSWVLGTGASGIGAAHLLLDQGARVILLDQRANAIGDTECEALLTRGAQVAMGADDLPADAPDLAVISPGVPLGSDWVRTLQQRNIPFCSELELAWTCCDGRVLAVTGSNGKSTAVTWCVEALRAAGQDARAAGNCGPAFSAALRAHSQTAVWVLEVSSFQLETCSQFCPSGGLLLNILPNHLDRHGSFDEYARGKASLFARMTRGEVAVVPVEWKNRLAQWCNGTPQWVSFGEGDGPDYTLAQNRVWHAGKPVLELADSLYGNEVMGISAAGICALLQTAGVGDAAIQAALNSLTPLPHRMTTVCNTQGIAFIDNSKATNLAALVASVRMCSGPVRLIAGGLAKEKDFRSAKEVLAQRARRVYLVGKAAEAMQTAWSEDVSCCVAGTLDQAVEMAWQEAAPGEVILLAPGCASFDQFRNFEERGRVFAGLAQQVSQRRRNDPRSVLQY